MEASPLTKAHDHAKAASVATQTMDTTVAINEHALAAGEFSNAARSTSSVEALRTLKLLELHHQKLSELLQVPSEPPSQQSIPDSEGSLADEKIDTDGQGQTDSPKPSERSETEGAAVAPSQNRVPLLQQQQQKQRRYDRHLSSSIASNLASARGIRSKHRGQPLSPSVSNEQAPGSLEVHARREGTSKTREKQKHTQSFISPLQPRPSKPETWGHDPLTPDERKPISNTSDEGFSRFYNTFGSLINRLSAPLAYAGLPLIAEEVSDGGSSSPKKTSSQRKIRPKISSAAEPDLSKIYSRATMRALAKEVNGPNDSFYFVPSTGGTVSYANILSFDHKERRRLAASVHGGDVDVLDNADDENLVETRDVHNSVASQIYRKRAGKAPTAKELLHLEELCLENKSLKEMLDKLSRRLHAFELNSQSSHLALVQSLRMQRPGSPMSSSGGGSRTEAGKGEAGADDPLRKRNKELEIELAMSKQQLTALQEDFERVQNTLDKYRDRWEKLKDGARARREAQNQMEAGGKQSKTMPPQSAR